jgi:hypothetical protein
VYLASEHQFEQSDHNDQADKKDDTDGASQKLEHFSLLIF